MLGFSAQMINKIHRLRPMDDEFFKLLASIKGVCQEIIRTLLDDNSIIIVETISQAYISNFARSITLDNLSTTSDGAYINIDVQKNRNNDDIRRIRFHEGAITAARTPKGVNFKDVPDVTVIYIAEYDVLGNGKMITEIHKHIESDDEITNISDGSRILIVNAKADDGSLKSQLLKMFLSTEVIYNENFPELSEAIKYFKTTEKGRGTMSETMEQIAKEYAAEIIKENETIQHENEMIQHENEMIQHSRAIIIIKGIDTIMDGCQESLESACNKLGVTVDDYNAAKELTLHDTF